MKGRWRHHRHHQAVDMDITAFMNLMVILVPFLLITAVFSRIAILDLALPEAGSKAQQSPPPQQLEIILRADRIEVARPSGKIVAIAKNTKGYDLKKLTTILKDIKTTRPEKRDATILLEPDIPYNSLIQVMDTVRSVHKIKDNRAANTELFPDIGIGDAPPVTRNTSP